MKASKQLLVYKPRALPPSTVEVDRWSSIHPCQTLHGIQAEDCRKTNKAAVDMKLQALIKAPHVPSSMNVPRSTMATASKLSNSLLISPSPWQEFLGDGKLAKVQNHAGRGTAMLQQDENQLQKHCHHTYKASLNQTLAEYEGSSGQVWQRSRISERQDEACSTAVRCDTHRDSGIKETTHSDNLPQLQRTDINAFQPRGPPTQGYAPHKGVACNRRDEDILACLDHERAPTGGAIALSKGQGDCPQMSDHHSNKDFRRDQSRRQEDPGWEAFENNQNIVNLPTSHSSHKDFAGVSSGNKDQEPWMHSDRSHCPTWKPIARGTPSRGGLQGSEAGRLRHSDPPISESTPGMGEVRQDGLRGGEYCIGGQSNDLGRSRQSACASTGVASDVAGIRHVGQVDRESCRREGGRQQTDCKAGGVLEAETYQPNNYVSERYGPVPKNPNIPGASSCRAPMSASAEYSVQMLPPVNYPQSAPITTDDYSSAPFATGSSFTVHPSDNPASRAAQLATCQRSAVTPANFGSKRRRSSTPPSTDNSRSPVPETIHSCPPLPSNRRSKTSPRPKANTGKPPPVPLVQGRLVLGEVNGVVTLAVQPTPSTDPQDASDDLIPSPIPDSRNLRGKMNSEPGPARARAPKRQLDQPGQPGMGLAGGGQTSGVENKKINKHPIAGQHMDRVIDLSFEPAVVATSVMDIYAGGSTRLPETAKNEPKRRKRAGKLDTETINTIMQDDVDNVTLGNRVAKMTNATGAGAGNGALVKGKWKLKGSGAAATASAANVSSVRSSGKTLCRNSGKSEGGVSSSVRSSGKKRSVVNSTLDLVEDLGWPAPLCTSTNPGSMINSESSAIRSHAASALLIDASTDAGLHQLLAHVGRSKMVVVALLTEVREGKAVQYYSSAQRLSQSQVLKLRRGRRQNAAEQAKAGVAGIDYNDMNPQPLDGPDLPPLGVDPTAPAGGIRGTEGSDPNDPGSSMPSFGMNANSVAVGLFCVDDVNLHHISTADNSILEPSSTLGLGPLYLLPFPSSQTPGNPCSEPAAKRRLAVLSGLLTNPNRPVVCCNSHTLLRELTQAGVPVPPSSQLRVFDPSLLAWLHEPQLVQRDEKEVESYCLEALAPRYGVPLAHFEVPEPPQVVKEPKLVKIAKAPKSSSGSSIGNCKGVEKQKEVEEDEAGQGGRPGAGTGPLWRLRAGLVLSARLAARVVTQVSQWLPPEALRVENQVLGMLAKMEAHGVACEPGRITSHRAPIVARLNHLRERAHTLLGRPINLGSAAQLAQALYTDLKLPAVPGTGRGASKTHAPTDEAALKRLVPMHALPKIVLEYRCLVNVLTKWIEPEWVREVEQRARESGSSWARCHCSWNQMSTATGRLSSSAPNLQAVTKYVIEPNAVGVNGVEGVDLLRINIRDAFVAPPGKLLLAADYGQVELRLLAHLSNDARLMALLSREGRHGDAFSAIATSWLRCSSGPGGVSKTDRETAKRVTYGVIYGLTPWGLAAALEDHGVDVARATRLIDSFLNHFQGVKAFMDRVVSNARTCGYITTLLGRRRPLRGLDSPDLRIRKEAERKAVNSTVQGSASDLIKLAMCGWDNWAQQQDDSGAVLVAQIHDELLFEVNAGGNCLQNVRNAVQHIMEAAAVLKVPIVVKFSAGPTWGSLHPM